MAQMGFCRAKGTLSKTELLMGAATWKCFRGAHMVCAESSHKMHKDGFAC